MADSNPIIIGGGITSGAPFTLGHLVYVTNVTPPQLTSYGPKVVTDSVSAVQYTAIPDASGTYVTVTNAQETLRIQGGAIIQGAGADSVLIGRGATADVSGSKQVVIGTLATDGTGTTGAVVIGYQANARGQSGVYIGRNAGAPASQIVSGVIIGDTATMAGTGGSNNVVVIGNNAGLNLGTSTGGNAVVVGGSAAAQHPSSVVIGYNAQAAFVSAVGQNTVTIGDTASSSKAGTTVIGGAATTVQSLSTVIGSGATATNTAKTSSIVIGQLATSGGTFNIVIGVGSNCTGGSNSIVIGSGALDDIGSNVGQFGSPNNDVQTFLIGAGNFGVTPAARLVRFTNGSGANNVPGAATIQAPLATGNGLPPSLVFAVGQQVAGSSSTLQTATASLTLSNTTAGGHLATFAGLISAAGLPTSAGAAGTLWVDTTGGLNIVKRA